MTLKTFWELLKDTGSEWLEHKAPRLGAALAYYTIFSLAPLLVTITGIAGLAFGREAVQRHLSGQIHDLVGEQGGQAILTMVEGASHPANGVVGTVLGIIMLIVGATGLFGQLQDSLNTIWEVQPRSGRGILGIIKDRFLSFSMILGIAFMLLVTLVVSTALAAAGTIFGNWQASIVGQIVNSLIDVGVITVLFAMIFRFLPDAKTAWKDVWLGALITAVLFTVGKLAIGLYLGHSGVASAYGAAGSLAVLLVWLYYSSQIFLFGAELTKTYADKFGSRIVPKENAVPVTPEAQAKEGLATPEVKQAAGVA